MRCSTPLGILLFALMPGLLAAAGSAQPGKAGKPTARARPAAPREPVVTRHAIQVHGQRLAYRATAGYLPVTDSAGKPLANIFFVSYTKEGEDASRRPLAFAFNGGPGASSVWLHLGGIGPKRVPLAAAGTRLPRVDRLDDNEYTWLPFTDLVFVDPVGTGYSRAAAGGDARQFYNVSRDVEVAGQFIRLYVTRYGRWLSPKVVIGESYGTTRAAGLASWLPHEVGLDLAGVVLLSSALNFKAFTPEDGNDLPYPLALPTYTAVAAYHHRLPLQAPSDLADVEQWALTDYTTALAQGDRLPAAERDRVLARLVEVTGLPRRYLEDSNLRVNTLQFAKALLRPQGQVVGLLDGRVAGADVSRLGQYPGYDPSLFITTGPYVAVINDYLRRGLGFQTTLAYEYLSWEVNAAWKYASGGRGYLYVGDDLGQAMTRDPLLRVFAAAGRYDLTTPYLSQRYVFDHLGLAPGVRRRLTFRIYASGHQIYTDLPALAALTADAAAFFAPYQTNGTSRQRTRRP